MIWREERRGVILLRNLPTGNFLHVVLVLVSMFNVETVNMHDFPGLGLLDKQRVGDGLAGGSDRFQEGS